MAHPRARICDLQQEILKPADQEGLQSNNISMSRYVQLRCVYTIWNTGKLDIAAFVKHVQEGVDLDPSSNQTSEPLPEALNAIAAMILHSVS